jgi:hypothetical protein
MRLGSHTEPASKALQGIGEKDGKCEEDPADIHQVITPAVVVQQVT